MRLNHPPAFPSLKTLLILGLLVASAACGCARNLNQRFEFENERNAVMFRTEGNYDLENGRLMEALANYTEAIRIWPADAPSHWGVGRIWLSVGEHDRAAASFTTAVAYDAEYENLIAEPVDIESPEIMRALLESRPPPDNAWVADDLR